MEIDETIYKGVLYTSYQNKTTRADDNRVGPSKTMRGGARLIKWSLRTEWTC